jgi:hypothetical protein
MLSLRVHGKKTLCSLIYSSSPIPSLKPYVCTHIIIYYNFFLKRLEPSRVESFAQPQRLHTGRGNKAEEKVIRGGTHTRKALTSMPLDPSTKDVKYVSMMIIFILLTSGGLVGWLAGLAWTLRQTFCMMQSIISLLIIFFRSSTEHFSAPTFN